MKKKIIILIIIIYAFNPIRVFANITCNDGSISPSCSDCHQGCCSYHGGCDNDTGEDNYDYEEDYNDSIIDENVTGVLYILGIIGAITGGYYIGKKRSEK